MQVCYQIIVVSDPVESAPSLKIDFGNPFARASILFIHISIY